MPYFQQFSTLWELGGKRAHSAHAHMYAAGHHDPLLDTPPGALIRHSPSPPVHNSQSELSNKEDAIGKETGDKRDDVIPHNDPNEVQLNRHIKLYDHVTFFIVDLLLKHCPFSFHTEYLSSVALWRTFWRTLYSTY